MDDGRTPDHGHPISSPCEPNGSGELKIFSAKNCIFALECIYSFLPFNFVIWQVVFECIYSLKHILLTYFRSVP